MRFAPLPKVDFKNIFHGLVGTLTLFCALYFFSSRLEPSQLHKNTSRIQIDYSDDSLNSYIAKDQL